MASILNVENINEMDELDLEFNKVTFDDNVDLQEYEILSVGNNDDNNNNNNNATKNIEEEYVLIEGNINDDPVNVSSDSEDEGPLIAPRNAASGDDRAHTPNKISKETRRRASPLARSPTMHHHKQIQPTSSNDKPRQRRRKKLGRRKQRIYDNNHLLNSEAFWKTFGETVGEDGINNIDFLDDTLGINFSKKDAGFKLLLKDPELLEDFLACKTFKSNSKKRNSKHKKNKNSSKTRNHQVNFDEGKRIRPRYGSY